MRIVFKKIPKLAIAFYVAGFFTLLFALFYLLYRPGFFEAVALQQIFIAGAIIVALGSVINNLYQFKSKNSRR